jgi:peptidoglycan/xylan/chitin deacetylase (PgdA/CDA1 family)
MRAWPELAAIGYRRLEAGLLASSGLTRRRLQRQSGVAVLMYHRVLTDDEDARQVEPGMFVRATTFRRQMEWIVRRWPVRPLGELVGNRVGAVGAAVTFDDGWRDNLTVAWPILEALGVRPTIFLVRDWTSAGRTQEGEFLRPAEVAAMAKAGVEFGAHSVSHPHLDRLPPALVEEEMKRSREAVEDWTGRECRVFAYPFGHHNGETADIARQLFPASVIVGGGWWKEGGDRARIPRIAIHQDMSSTSALFAARLAVSPGGP